MGNILPAKVLQPSGLTPTPRWGVGGSKAGAFCVPTVPSSPLSLLSASVILMADSDLCCTPDFAILIFLLWFLSGYLVYLMAIKGQLAFSTSTPCTGDSPDIGCDLEVCVSSFTQQMFIKPLLCSRSKPFLEGT